MSDIKEALNPRDTAILDAEAGQNWLPKEPRELLLPYINENQEDLTDIDVRRKKAKEVYDGYGKLIKTCSELKDEIAESSKGVKITLDPNSQLKVINAVKRLFGGNGREITFEMYKLALEKLSDVSAESIPKPEVKK